ncbi:hypothetical protein ACLMJK_003301 [Lecanora helva]
MMLLPTEVSNSAQSLSAHHREKSASETECEDARIIFNKTIAGHYRNGKTGYRQVGALFLTWADDDMECKNKEVVKLGDLFRDEFHFKTEYYEIPSERWETALHKRVADFCHEYDSAEDLAIIYYGGHAYEGTETKQFKLAAKYDNAAGNGDPTAFFNDIRACVRLPACDQLMILDCCYAAKAFSRDHVGKRKFELLTSSPHDSTSPAPYLAHSFTRALYDALKRLIQEHPRGFCTSHLYRELYHTMPTAHPPRKPNPKPLLFDQARHSFGRIWLRPQSPVNAPPRAPQRDEREGGRLLKLTFHLGTKPDLAAMNELALHLQFLPHVKDIRIQDLCAPQEQIATFMRQIMLANKLKPLVRKLRLRRQGRKVRELVGQTQKETPPSLIELHLSNAQQPALDWCSAVRDRSQSSETAHEALVQKTLLHDRASHYEEPGTMYSPSSGSSETEHQEGIANGGETLPHRMGKRQRSLSSDPDHLGQKFQRIRP